MIAIIDPVDGSLTIEGLSAGEMKDLAGDLLPDPKMVNCARPTRREWVPFERLPESASTDSSALRLHRIYHGSLVDGPGRRNVVQVQGCPIRCAGCYVP